MVKKVESVTKEKTKFRRVAIEEDSDEEDEEPKIEEVGAAASSAGSTHSTSTSSSIDSKFPLKTAREIEEHTKEAKRLMKAGAAAFQRKLEGKVEEPAPVKETKKPAAPQKKPEAAAPKIEEVDTGDMEEVPKK